MKIILKETIESLGIIGSEVNVSKGYARNYLLPQNKAVPATAQNRNILAQQKEKIDLQIAKEITTAKEMARQLEGVVCKISGKVSEEDRLYGSVSVQQIISELERQNITVSKKMVALVEPIKTLGTFQIPIHIYKGVHAEITVEVAPE
jgi:large subunit ribosomal protein L9